MGIGSLQREYLRREIFRKFEAFKNNGSSCSVRQYLASAVILSEYEKRLSEICEADEYYINLSELREMSRNTSQILKNLGIEEAIFRKETVDF